MAVPTLHMLPSPHQKDGFFLIPEKNVNSDRGFDKEAMWLAVVGVIYGKHQALLEATDTQFIAHTTTADIFIL